MMDYTCRNTIIQNMKDFGCDEDTIKAFLECFDKDDLAGQKRIIERYRRMLLEKLHMKQKEIDILDYMVYQLDKCNCKPEACRKGKNVRF